MAAPVTFDVQYTEQRQRLSNALRYFYALPHLIIVAALSYAAFAVTFVHWWYVLFTGRRHQGMWKFAFGVSDWSARVNAYLAHTYDTYPNFGFERGDEPVTYGFAYEEQANRLTCALRMIWIIPAAIIAFFVFIGAAVMIIISWFAILFTGRQSQGRQDFIVRVLRFGTRVNAYGMLLTDTYPKFE
jgi:hypothetical protein